MSGPVMRVPETLEVRDESGRLIYRAGTESDVARFKRWRAKARAAEPYSLAWWRAKDRIDHGPGTLCFDESGDIYGTRREAGQ